MAEVCGICGVKTEMPEKHARKYLDVHKALLAEVEVAEEKIEAALEVKAEAVKSEGILDRVKRMVSGG